MWGHDMPRPSPPPVSAPAPRVPPSRRNVAVVTHAQYVLTINAAPASRAKAAVSKAAWLPCRGYVMVFQLALIPVVRRYSS